MDLKKLYYERFLPFLVNHYRDILKGAKPGHCMKITGLALSELKQLIGLIRPIK